MSCFHLNICSWRDPREARKVGAFLASPSGSTNATAATHESLQSEPSKRPDGRIPWIWSHTFHDEYELGERIGAGNFSVVHSATRRGPPYDSYAIKIVQRKKMTTHKQLVDFKDEVQILASLNHENISRLIELYKDPQFFFVVLEKLEGGELFDRLCEKTIYHEKDARDAMRMIFEAVAYCHDQQIAHRDLKPENLLLKDKTDHSVIKVADFGFAKFVERPNSLTTLCGSPAYTAPEIINYKPYDQRADNWSLGVILFTVLGGYPPFYESTVHQTFQRIRQGSFTFHNEYWAGVSPDAKKLIKGLLTRDPEQRITAKQALSSCWMTGRGDKLAQNCLKSNQKRMKKFNEDRKEPTPVNKKTMHSVSMYWLVSRR